MALTDYKDRKIDIMLSNNYSGKLKFVFSNNIVAGIQKMVQSFILRLFTSIRSNIINPNAGNFFSRDISESAQIDPGLTYQALSIAITDTVEQMQQEQSDFADENIVSARISDYTQEKGEMFARIELVSQIGENYDFVVPINIPISQ